MTVAELLASPKRPLRCAAVMLCANAEDRRAVLHALKDWDVDFRDQPREVVAALRASGAPLFISRPATSDLRPHSTLIREIREDAPAFDVVALAHAGESHRSQIVALTELGLGEVLDIDDPEFAERLKALVRRTRLKIRVAECGRELSAGLPPKVARLIRWAFQRGLRCGSVSAFAAAHGLSNQTLRLRLAKYHLTPEDLLRWRRVIAAFVLFEHTLLTVDRVAKRVGFPSGPALHNSIQRTAAISRAQVLKNGGTPYLMKLLREKMELRTGK